MKRVTMKKRISAPSLYVTYQQVVKSWSAVEPPAIHALTDEREDWREVESRINRRREVFGFMTSIFRRQLVPSPKPTANHVTAGASEDRNKKTNISESHNKSLKLFYLEL